MTRSVLVIDDDRQMVQTLCAVLRLHGWEPTAGYSGEDAIAAVRTRPFAAVLMDVRMPGLDGVEAFRRIRAEYPALPVILMTAYAAQELLAQAEKEGVLMILPKPLPLDRLTETLAELSHTGPILVLDDEPEFLETLGAILTSRNHGVLKANSLEEALDVLSGASPTVVVMDLNLGRLRPRDAVLAIKRVSPEVLLILYSGPGRRARRNRFRAPGGLGVWSAAQTVRAGAPARVAQWCLSELSRFASSSSTTTVNCCARCRTS